MPTDHVLPESAERLQDIADALWKAKKVLVVTGAGISTNSGIPDFRSKNGLYSLIQAQFEAVASHQDGDGGDGEDGRDGLDTRDEPPPKRRKLLRERDTLDTFGETSVKREATAAASAPTEPADSAESVRVTEAIPYAPNANHPPLDSIVAHESIVVELPNIRLETRPQLPATPLRGARVGLSGVPTRIMRDIPSLPPSSSPLSSPPPILFDPEEEISCASSESESSDPESDTDYNDVSCPSKRPVLSSQSSFSSSSGSGGRTGGLPVMKGRELFDASIWADPVKTSVFYTFATTLRQKTRHVVPTRSHRFISLLRDTGKLVRCYTQNIDEIEEKVGLSTSLMLGPGRKGRFSTRPTPRTSLSGGATQTEGGSQADENIQDAPDSQDTQGSQDSQLHDSQSSQEAPKAQESSEDAIKPVANRDPKFRGVECVFLHGSLRLLRCFRCGQTAPWDEDGREHETLSGRQPTCPQCEGATAAREGRGKRALAVGKLRPDIVLYGEEHPNAHLISPIVQHDISLAPDMLLILGTSLKVHGLKVLVREFSKAVHSRGGKVVFVNLTKPPESVWSEIIDYWVQWDCDAWVQDLQDKKSALWLPPGSVAEPKKKRKSLVEKELREKEREERRAMKKERREQEKKEKKERKQQDVEELRARKDKEKHERKEERRERREQERMAKKLAKVSAKREARTTTQRGGGGIPQKRPRHSAPAGLERSTGYRVGIVWENNENAATDDKKAFVSVAHPPTPSAAAAGQLLLPAALSSPLQPLDDYSIVSAVKSNTRQRRPKKIFEAGGVSGQVMVEAHTAATKSRGSRAPLGPLVAQALAQAPPVAAGGAQEQPWTGTDRLVRQLAMELTESKTLLSPQPQQAKQAQQAQQQRLPSPQRPMLPSIRELFPDLTLPKQPASPFFMQDLLGHHYGFPPPYPQEWSCGDQLRHEADERVRSRRSLQRPGWKGFG